MSYLEEFEKQINQRDLAKLLELWEEYCTNDTVDVEEFVAFLKKVKKSDLAVSFGSHLELALPLWQTIQDLDSSYRVLKAIIDVQNTNSPVLAEAAFQLLKAKHGSDPHFNDRIRMIGMRAREGFQGSLSNYDLLAHLEKGKFVFHSGGWGCGEIMDYSLVREQIGVEFEHVTGIKYFSLANAFKTLEPLQEDHFLVKRFANPDAFEAEAKKDPVGTIKLLLKDLGPKTAAEIKEEVCELVIPEEDWTKWWQGVRAKLKKEPLVQTPKNIREPFYIRQSEMTHEELLREEIHGKEENRDIMISSYSLIRDVPKVKKNQEIYDTLENKLQELLGKKDLKLAERLQVRMMLEQTFGVIPEGQSVADLIRALDNVENTIEEFEIVALKKRALIVIRESRSDWKEIFLKLLLKVQLNPLRDYLFGELEGEPALEQELRDLLAFPMKSPETVFWYFQKLLGTKKKTGLLFGDKEGECEWFNALLVVFHKIEHETQMRELSKKIFQCLSADHYKAIRDLFQGASIAWVKEFLLLLSKCSTFEESEQKVFRSLAQVVHPSIEGGDKQKSKHDSDIHIFWATEKSYQASRERAQQIGSIEMVQNAEEVKKARELGDLRENAEYKAACERRRRLQHDLRVLGDQINRARVLTPDDVNPDAVGIGAVVTLKNGNGKNVEYTLLGSWDADVDAGILSIQSRLALAMLGRKVGDIFTFGDEEYTVSGLKSFFEK